MTINNFNFEFSIKQFNEQFSEAATSDYVTKLYSRVNFELSMKNPDSEFVFSIKGIIKTEILFNQV